MSLAAGQDSRTRSGLDRLPGVTPPASREPRPGFLTDTIAEMKLANGEQIDAAINESRVRGVAPELLLVQSGHLSHDDLARARAEHTGLDYVDLSNFDRDRGRDTVIGRDAGKRYRALPLAISGRSLVVAIADPIDAPAVADIAATERLEVIPVVASISAIEARLDELPETDAIEAEPLAEPPQLHPIQGGAAKRSDALCDGLADRIVERVDAALDEVARSEILKALDDATAEIERLSAELEQTEQRARSLESERDELRASLGSPADPNPS